MTTYLEKFTMKNILLHLAVTLVLLTISACGGGGGGGSSTTDGGSSNTTPAAKTTAKLTVSLNGTLPTSTAIAGAAFTLTLPTGVTPANTNGVVASGVITPSGTFAGGTQTPPVYTAASGTLQVTLVNSVPAGVTQVGEVATITLQLANGATPTAASFGVSAVSVIDASLYAPIAGMNAVVANVTLQ
jgi:hypothetical protein